MKRIAEVFDCWFESGSMPYAQMHYPFENKERFEQVFPADFVAEGQDQTRGWFYTLSVLSAALFAKPTFKNVIVNGLVLATDGKKMSKRWKNYTPPEELINSFGADSVRLYMFTNLPTKFERAPFFVAGNAFTFHLALRAVQPMRIRGLHEVTAAYRLPPVPRRAPYPLSTAGDFSSTPERFAPPGRSPAPHGEAAPRGPCGTRGPRSPARRP